MASIISSSATSIVYEDDRNDWRLTAFLTPTFYMEVKGIEPILDMNFASGVNLDSLAEVIAFAKDDLLSRGVNWENK